MAAREVIPPSVARRSSTSRDQPASGCPVVRHTIRGAGAFMENGTYCRRHGASNMKIASCPRSSRFDTPALKSRAKHFLVRKSRRNRVVHPLRVELLECRALMDGDPFAPSIPDGLNQESAAVAPAV